MKHTLPIHAFAALSALVAEACTERGAHADNKAPEPYAAAAAEPRFHEEVEYYSPTKPERPIQSVFLNVAGGVEWVAWRLTLLGGLTMTGAEGSIDQLNARLESVRYRAKAAGAGPVLMVSAEPFRVGAAALSLDAVAGVVLYDTHFPPGGDIYNFTFRFGGTLGLAVAHHVFVGVGARWMHISNGQGIVPHNPSYEGLGAHLGTTWGF